MVSFSNRKSYKGNTRVYHSDLKPFVQKMLEVKGLFRTLYLVFLLLTLICFIFYCAYQLVSSVILGETPFFLYQLVFVVITIPILLVTHEGIHALGMLIVGINKIKFGMSTRPLYFYVTAVSADISSSKFVLVAIAPFVIVSSIFLILIILLPNFSVTWISLLFIHTNGCAGDFGLLNYIQVENILNVRMDATQAVTEFYY